jgi:riboflavin synthase
MFTGIVETKGTLVANHPVGGDRRLEIDSGDMGLERVALGDSIAVAGVCLTVVELNGSVFAADVSVETLDLTTLGSLSVGDQVNLEMPLTPQSRLGGHYVTGHVDGLGRLIDRQPDARSERLEFELPEGLERYVAAKGSVTVEGVSLTVNSVSGSRFSVNLIPHTLDMTTLGQLAPGDRVNIEVDILARYVARFLETGRENAEGGPVGSHNQTNDHGFA